MPLLFKPFGFLLALVRALYAFISMGLMLLVYVVTIPILGNSSARSFRLRRTWIRWAMPVFGMKMHHHGKPIDEPALYVSNHKTFTDPMATCRFLNAFVIAKSEVGNIPILSQGAEITGVIFVKRENKESRSSVRQTAIDTILSGENVLVYPEGTTTGANELRPYRYGMFVEAAERNIPIVPISIGYTKDKDHWTGGNIVGQFFKQFSYPRTEIYHTIGKPLRGIDGKDAAILARDWTIDQLEIIKSY